MSTEPTYSSIRAKQWNNVRRYVLKTLNVWRLNLEWRMVVQGVTRQEIVSHKVAAILLAVMAPTTILICMSKNHRIVKVSFIFYHLSSKDI